jgi:hypothetical protein
MSVGRAVASDMCWSAVAASVVCVVEIPRFTRFDQLAAAWMSAYDVAGFDQWTPSLT